MKKKTVKKRAAPPEPAVEPKKGTTGFALPGELLAALDAKAAELGMKRSVFVSKVLHEAVGLPFVYSPPGRRWPAKVEPEATDKKPAKNRKPQEPQA